ncbi:uncharacterized protein Z520_09942 [Fonsecaea multimorphosa CBS 102226]|uniref:Uncharacterized protein n=1 Tax=Fonsecaea multimorphosa CBS 102226 TaxID=1442371 RepID=A0A0D2JLN0_9EURO|nr:uncharacterized protein Z520_09942 [Fonsecaea multimorphosa CBS 102226]KIX94232.1 hypothetical protein Z520_09942 [Fonsecaea multimorphosa CBS 102226]OAL19914.1 hypothetical protein AYO22_09441 [Fonsecaea multimorphosa]
MASQVAQSQLLKALSLNAPGIIAPDPDSIPTALPNPPPQQPFPDYILGYDPTADVKFVTEAIPSQPTNGQHSAHPFHMLSEANLHPLLFQMEPYPSILNGVAVPLLVNEATNQVERGNRGRQLRYFSHLPRWIAHNVSGMLMELWLRLDPRVDTSDIIARLYLPAGMKSPQANTFNMRRLRFRECIQAPLFTSSRQHPTAMEVDLISKRTREQLLLNTCMVVDLQNSRLLAPVLNNNKAIVGYVDSGLPIDYFLRGHPTPVPIPSDHQMLVLELRKRMQTLALRRGLGNGPEDYRRVPKSLHPAWWHKGAKRDAIISDVDNKTHDEWILEKLEEYPGVTRSGVQRARALMPQHLSVPQPQVQLQLPLSPPAGHLAQQSPPTPMSPIDPRFAGTGAAALLVAPVSPEHLTNAEGGTSYYVEAIHRREYAAAEAARS